MRLYQPLQHLIFVYLPDLRAKKTPFLKSSINILIDAGETLARDNNEKDPLVIVYKTIRDESSYEKRIFDDSVLIDKLPEGPKMDYKVRVIVN
jgi:hypothetical protein